MPKLFQASILFTFIRELYSVLSDTRCDAKPKAPFSKLIYVSGIIKKRSSVLYIAQCSMATALMLYVQFFNPIKGKYKFSIQDSLG